MNIPDVNGAPLPGQTDTIANPTPPTPTAGNTGTTVYNGNTIPVSGITTPQSAPNYPTTTTTPTTAHDDLKTALSQHEVSMSLPPDTTQTSTPTTATNSRQPILDRILAAMDSLGNKVADTATENAKAGVDTKLQLLTNLTNQYNTTKQNYQNQIIALQKNPEGLFGTGLQDKVDEITRQQNQDLANIAVQQNAANGNYETATKIAAAAVAAKYEPLQAEVDNLQKYYSLTANDMTDSEKQQAQAAITEKEDTLKFQRDKELIAYKQQISQYSNNPADGATTFTGPNGKTINVPSIVSPYFNTSQNGSGWVDASTLQGTAKQKTAIIQAATAAGIKVITNKNQAADLSNIKDVNNKLDTISGIMGTIDQPDALSRGLYGLGLTKLAVMAQTNPQQAASGSLSSIGLDVLKAISGVQGFRGNQAAIKQVQDHLPTIYDDNATAQQKIAYVRQLVSDREDGLLGMKSTPPGSTTPEGTTRLTGPDGKAYNVPNDQVTGFIKAGGH